MQKLNRILVTGAGGPASYNFIESLRKNPEGEKFWIIGVDNNPYHLELINNVNKRYRVPSANDKDYIDRLNYIIKTEKIDFLHCQSDKEVMAIAKNLDKIETKTFLPHGRTLKICEDKLRFNKELLRNGLSVPEAYNITSDPECSLFKLKLAVSLILKELLKTNKKAWLRTSRGAGSRASLVVNKIRHTVAWIDYWKKMKKAQYMDFMISEFLPGPEYAFQSVWKDGELLMSQARERIEYLFGHLSPTGQSSSPSVAKTVHNDEVNNLAYNAIKAIDPNASGVFCVDMKTDKDGVVKIIEINAGRFFTTSLFFSMAGANMPYYYTKIGLGQKVEHKLKKFNNVPENLYWIRGMDMGYKLVKNGK